MNEENQVCQNTRISLLFPELLHKHANQKGFVQPIKPPICSAPSCSDQISILKLQYEEF